MLPSLPDRKTIRLAGYDYSLPGYYYVTICAYQQAAIFGSIDHFQVIPSYIGQICIDEWIRLPERFSNLELDEYVLMPNHFHGMIRIIDDVTKKEIPRQFGQHIRGSISVVIQAYKSSVTRKCRNAIKDPTLCVWQSRYWEHILRNEKEVEACRYYIQNNPNQWQETHH